MLERSLGAGKKVQPVDQSQQSSIRSHILPAGTSHAIIQPAADASNPNSSVEVFLQFESLIPTTLPTSCNGTVRAHLFVIMTMMQEPAFD